MRCASCGHDNPDVNRFCGMCGGILDRRRAAPTDNVVSMPTRLDEIARPADPATNVVRKETEPQHLADEHFPAPAQPEQYDDRSFSIFGVDTAQPMRDGEHHEPLRGPSFLGLGEDTSGSDYLLEEEESHGGRWIMLLLLLVALGALGYMQYRADQPVTSIWSAIKSRATGQPAQTATAKPSPQDPSDTGVQPTQPTSTKPDANPQPDASATAQNPPATTPATEKAAASDEIATSAKNPDEAKTATAEKTEAAAAAAAREKPAKGKKTSPDLIAKAQHPESDRDAEQDVQDEEASAKTSRNKPSAATTRRAGSTEDDALVTRAQGYLYGKGGGQSCSMALSLLKQAAGRGNSKADSQLGAMYATGNCAPFDRAEAFRWFSKAAESDPNNSYLQRNRDMMWREMSPQERRKVLE